MVDMLASSAVDHGFIGGSTITHQYQQNEQSPLNSDGQQLHTNINKTKESLNIDGQQLHTNIN
jgi:hypothetical protein